MVSSPQEPGAQIAVFFQDSDLGPKCTLLPFCDLDWWFGGVPGGVSTKATDPFKSKSSYKSKPKTIPAKLRVANGCPFLELVALFFGVFEDNQRNTLRSKYEAKPERVYFLGSGRRNVPRNLKDLCSVYSLKVGVKFGVVAGEAKGFCAFFAASSAHGMVWFSCGWLFDHLREAICKACVEVLFQKQ